MKMYIQVLAIVVAVISTFLVGENSATDTDLLKMVRVPLMEPEISEEIVEINQSLMVASHSKELTESEKNWKETFLISLKNWFDLLEAIQRTEAFKEKVKENEEGHFDAWMSGGYSNYFQMTYEFTQNPDMKQVWNMFIYGISADGLDTSTIKLENADVTFQMSYRKIYLPNEGRFVYAKDRVFTIAVSIKTESSLVKIFHEIVPDGETPKYDYTAKPKDRKAKQGMIRLLLSDVKIYLQLSLTEKDKRFLIKNKDGLIENYFQMPVIEDLQITIGDVLHGIDSYQVTEGFKDVNEGLKKLTEQQRLDLKKEQIGIDLDVAKADKIIDDFVAFLKSEENNKELVDRVKVALINKFSKAIMNAPDITVVRPNILAECLHYDTIFPQPYDPESIKMYREEFFMSFSYATLVDGVFEMIDTWIGNEDDKNLYEQGNDLLEKQIAAVGSVIYESGFDDEEDLEATHNKYFEEHNLNHASIPPKKKLSWRSNR